MFFCWQCWFVRRPKARKRVYLDLVWRHILLLLTRTERLMDAILITAAPLTRIRRTAMAMAHTRILMLDLDMAMAAGAMAGTDIVATAMDTAGVMDIADTAAGTDTAAADTLAATLVAGMVIPEDMPGVAMREVTPEAAVMREVAGTVDAAAAGAS